MPNLSEFDYELPAGFIAQKPLEKRDRSKLMVLDGNQTFHKNFCDLPDYFVNGDVLVLNDTRVIPARLTCRKSTGGRVELLLMNLPGGNRGELYPRLTENDNDELRIECLIRGKVRSGTKLMFDTIPLEADIDEHIEEGRYYVSFKFTKEQFSEINNGNQNYSGDYVDRMRFLGFLEKYGKLPLPPYIKTGPDDTSGYQTVFSSEKGSIAAPTAGLHFTDSLLDKLKKNGVKICFITLHISYGTFKPVRVDNIEDHRMDFEYYNISHESAELLNQARSDRCLTAVGTTSVRTLEAAYQNTESITSTEGETDLFIFPGYKFNSGISRLITNFHFPRSTLMMLVSAFAGTARIKKAYELAIQNKYRFYSFGDAMFILQKG